MNDPETHDNQKKTGNHKKTWTTIKSCKTYMTENQAKTQNFRKLDHQWN